MTDTSGRQKRYTQEFKLQAAKLIAEGGYTYHQVSQQLGVSDWALRCWVKAFRDSGHLLAQGPDGPPGRRAQDGPPGAGPTASGE